ncbi:hypothetical protein E8L99_09505 [Phreatobacter aquaticus]|uniref:Lipocalin-like domain-containing protein n=1 Tax=Phreatobacter aquaticus TaxID=2570229 RepID=A0A4D7QLD2_9HYPH|nr:hypothetical protein [Phreatobacter aquaticus]QCK85977.1 hypothetical protein E8L99_09505 [Phreatobacter aquaticus]
MSRLALAILGLLATTPAFAQTAEQFIGRWGFVSYWNEEDRAKSITGARAECGHPYIIARGPKGGPMMHGADAAAPSELEILQANGKAYLVTPDDNNAITSLTTREIVFFDANTFITRYVVEQAHSRYGMMVYARCGAAPARR